MTAGSETNQKVDTRVSRKRSPKLRALIAAGTVLLIAATGVRIWWARGAPERAERAAAVDRAQALERRLEQARAAVSERPRDAEAYQQLAAALLAAGLPDESLATLRKGRDAVPQDRSAWQALANVYLAQKRLTAAEETFVEMTRRWPENGDAYQGLAAIHRQLGRQRQALDAARRAVRLAPDEPLAHYMVGTIIEEIGAGMAFPAGQQGLLEEGRRHLERAQKALPEHPDVPYRRGRLSLLLRRFDEARQSLEEASRRTPERMVVWLALSEAKMRRGDVDGAIAAARRAREVAPTESDAPLALGRALLLKSDRASLEEAAAAFQEAARLNPGSAQCQDRLGTALVRLDRLQEARVAFERAEALDATNPYPVQQLAQIYRRTGDSKRAAAAARYAGVLAHNESLLRQVQRASSAHPENHRIHLALADRYREIGWLRQAEDEYQVTLSLAPGDAAAKQGLAQTRRLLVAKGTP
jgi:tetratricopeptide (TPR) repeat protein